MIQTIPRTIVYDMETGTHLLQWPVEEVEKLRLGSTKFSNITVAPGSVVPLDVGKAAQVSQIKTKIYFMRIYVCFFYV